MKIPRRQFLHLAAGAAALPLSVAGGALDCPDGARRRADILARLMGQWLSERLGRPVIIDNRPGAGTNIGTEAAVRAAPDGYTLVLLGPPAAINATLFGKLNFNVASDIAQVASIARAPNVLEVSLSVPVRTVPQFIAYAKANPGKLNMASDAIGGSPHVSGELFKMMAGVDMVHVPYRGLVAALTDMLSGRVQVYFGNLPGSIEYIKAGKVRALAVTTASRSDALPALPTVAEYIPGYEASPWWGVGVPRNTPAEIIDKLNKEINAALAEPKMQARIADLGATVLAGSPADFGKLIADETEKWAKVVKFSGARAD
jgi:tripartite-type tricarboxylate transporter receptor subunit TctC